MDFKHTGQFQIDQSSPLGISLSQITSGQLELHLILLNPRPKSQHTRPSSPEF